mmetsp:Transcript_50135/g.74852  ORF Transcript_50135/g.74852 Transcript_50135/m.74852 type:complete len:330 (-) Transcript_50135:520-1509(-)
MTSAWKVVLIALSTLIVGFQLGSQYGMSTSFLQMSPGDTTTSYDGRASSRTTADRIEPSYKLAYEESLGFFDDIDEREWGMLKQKVHRVSPNTNGNPYRGRSTPPYWFQNHYEPDFACRHEGRIGRLGDGGKWVCDPHRLMGPENDCLVYSVGSNGDASFEAAVKTDIGQHCEIHVFDMRNYTDRVEPTGSIFHQWGLGSENSQGRFEYKTLKDTVKELGHEGRTIDIFKIDCEKCEWTTYQSWLEANVTLRQVLVEVHETKDEKIPLPEAPDFFRSMYLRGYVIFHKEPNIQFWRFARCLEYAFILLDKKFFLDENGTSILLPVGDQE